MTARARRTAASLALAALALGAAACTAAPPAATNVPVVTPAATTSVQATAAPKAGRAVSSGPIVTPANGGAPRKAILKAGSAGLGVSGNITVYQLFSQGSAAVGDVLPAGGVRTFFALTGGPDAWTIAWSAPFGSTLANADALEAAAPLVSPELAAKIVWNKKVPKPAAATPTLASFETFATKSAKSFAGSTYTGPFTLTAKIAKDSTGIWWGNASAEPATEGLDPIGVWGHYVNGKWSGQIADFSSDDAEADYFPADVIPKLTLP
jgi:hypothetical protein